MAFQKALKLDEIWDGEKAGISLLGRKILLIHLEGRVYAYEDRCPHKSVPLSQGRLEHGIVTCAAHEWTFDACSGNGINPLNARLKPYPIKVEDGLIWVDVSEHES